MRILKFGGTSVGTAERVRAVAAIVTQARGAGEPVAVVVSAFGGVTDALLGVTRRAGARDEGFRSDLAAIERRHEEAATALSADGDRDALLAEVAAVHAELARLADGMFLLGETSARTLDRFVGAGEDVSARCVAAALRRDGVPAAAVDARTLIVTDASFGNAHVHAEPTREKVRAHFATADAAGAVQVVTGFVAATPDGEPTTLGRGGSDYTASLLGAALDASVVEIWTDVDGVLSADPRIVHDAVLADRLTYDELMELSHFGAKVVYPPSVRPTRAQGIPLLIRNAFHPDRPGTRVTAAAEARGAGHARTPTVRGLASIPHLDLLRLEGAGMIGVPGIAGRLFGALARHGVSVILISQASSEHSICFAVAPASTDAAVRGVAEEFAVERRAGLIDELVVERDLAVVAAVGEGMRERSGVAGALFAVLGRHGINVRAIAQGSSELNISLVVSARDEARTLRAIHDAFFVAGERTVDLYLAGAGNVGKALLAQLAAHGETLLRERRLRLRLAGIGVSRAALLDSAGMDPREAPARVRSGEGTVAPERLLEAVESDRGRDRVFVDCTASPGVAAGYERALDAGAAVVTANKLRLAGSMDDWRATALHPGGRLYHETTVGAALPVIGTLRDLVATGDHVRRIEGVLSGTLAFLFDELFRGAAFSDVLRRAAEMGYTEPDPREDLGGRDVARKLLILSRLAGRTLEPADVRVEGLLEGEWNAMPLAAFLERLEELDEGFAARVEAARGRGKRIVYLATLDGDGATVGPREVDERHPAVGDGTDNIVAFTTDRYAGTPLVVRGPGAGPELTASGVFADILRAVAEGDGTGEGR